MIAAIVLASLFHLTAAPTAADIIREADLPGLLNEYAPPGVTTKAVDCGQINAFYDLNGHIIVCNEMVEDMALVLGPDSAADALRFVVLHEVGHAVISIDDIPFTGNEELAADEYATVMLLEAGESDATLAMATYMAKIGSAVDDPMAPHPSTFRRAAVILGYTEGATNPGEYTSEFEAFYRAANAWARLLGR